MEIPGYRIERLIAEGGMSSVFLAVQESLGRRVALKLLKKFDSPQHARRFLEEARIIASLEHRNIITIYDVGAIGERHYIAMEYLEGGSLQDRIDRGIRPEAAIDLLENIAVCLHFVHRKGIVHRDVKPSNILFHVDGTPKLTDFGIAVQRDRDQEQTMDGSAFGSPYYLSPEQAEGRTLDGRSDIYALGIVFFQMLTGRKPYAARSHIETIAAHLSHPIPMLPDALSGYQRLLERMIAKRPGDRIACAAHLVEEIRETRLVEGQRQVEARAHPQRASDLLTRFLGLLRAAPTAVKTSATLAAVLIVVLGTLPSTDTIDGDPAPGSVAAPVTRADATGRSAAIVETSSREAAPVVKEFRLAPARPLPASPAIAGPDIEQADKGPSRPHAEATMPSPTVKPQQSPAGGLAMTADEQAQSDTDDAPSSASATAPQAAVETTADSQPAGNAWPTSNLQTVIAAHLRAGDEALQANRLTTPVDDSAFTHYSKVLELAPRHAAARAGIDRVADSYRVLASKAQRKGDDRLTRVYLERGLKVRKDHAGLLALRAELDSAEQIGVAELAITPSEPSEPIEAPPQATLEDLRGREGTGNIVKDFMHVWRTVFD
ncbi:MAG: protein kinase [Sedimenticolaceae bacterium]